MDLKNKRVTVFGLGKSGLAAARKLVSVGAKVTASDVKKGLAEALPGVTLELGGHTLASIEGADLVVVSPGIHLDIPVLVAARQRNIPIISEIELASFFLTKPIIAVTGTNGKTTTTTLIGEMLRAGGKRAAVGGNIGAPLVEIDDKNLDYIVAEVSSYQLETIESFHPWISLFLNIQPDHLERHRNMAEYIKEKQRLFMNQTGDDYLVYNQDDPLVVEMVKPAKAKKIGFAKSTTGIITLPPERIRIPGRHNLENALAAAQAVSLCGVSLAVIAEVLRAFPGVEHRIEFVTQLNGVEYYNDSKGTNPDSTMVAIDTFPGRGIILILGGRDKGVDLAPLAAKIKQSVKSVVLIGEAAERFAAALHKTGFQAVHRAGFSLEKAMEQAAALSVPGDAVILSPACASFDMFDNFEQRGTAFKKLCLDQAK